MAIKTQSQLPAFDNGHDNPHVIGEQLALYAGKYLTDNDRIGAAGESSPSAMFIANDHYYNTLFEVSKPSNPGKLQTTTEYASQKLTYEDLVKNILWDVKDYLNMRNHLDDYDLRQIISGDYKFYGDKTLCGDVSILGQMHVKGDAQIDGVFATNAISAVSCLATRLNVIALDDQSNCGITADCMIHVSGDNHFISGYAAGLTDGHTYGGTYGISAGGYLNSIDLTSTINSEEDDSSDINVTSTVWYGYPTYFLGGLPYELSCVKTAAFAYNLTDSSGNGINCGTAGVISTEAIPPSKTVVKFENGAAISCNEIDFAHHAFWSDLGERYLPDEQYEPGTLVKFGGPAEITIADTEVNAIVSTKAFDLNACLKDGIVIALCGRVPTKVKGKVQKFDKMMLSDTPGVACVWDGSRPVIGQALEENLNEGIKLVECVTRLSL